jgi:hypothetical protein
MGSSRYRPWMRAITTIVLMTAGLGVLTACAKPEISTFPSPDGRLVAKLIDDRGGGAMTSAYQRVKICPQGGQPLKCKAVFEGENMDGRSEASRLFGPMNVSWNGPHKLTISFCGGNVTKSVPLVRVDDIDVAVELAKETRTDWPSTVPPDRRMGPGPCL